MTRYQDDFYDAVNGEWEKTAVIPDDKPRTGGFSDLADEIEDLMLDTTDDWLAGKNVPEDSILQNFVKFHRMTSDYEKREAVGVAPVLPLIKEYKALTSFSILLNVLQNLKWLENQMFPFGGTRFHECSAYCVVGRSPGQSARYNLLR